LSYPRRQQFRRLWHAAASGWGCIAAVALALTLAIAGVFAVALALLLTAAALGIVTGHCLKLAARSGIGARSEEEVRRQLAALASKGWRIRHSLPWQGGGDVDSLAVAPNGVGFAIETKTRTYDERHLGRVVEQARWLGRRRRRWCGGGAVPVLCVVRAAGVERYERGVLVVSIDRLVPVLCEVANGMARQSERLVGLAGS
jgi:Nuclease-related domain